MLICNKKQTNKRWPNTNTYSLLLVYNQIHSKHLIETKPTAFLFNHHTNMDNNVELELQALNEEVIIHKQNQVDGKLDEKQSNKSNYKKDIGSIIFLMYLYFLQGLITVFIRSHYFSPQQ